MIPKIGQKYVITTDQWFYAPDGQQYRAVFGTVTGIHSDEETLGIKTNRTSTNWYITVGNMIIAGCQIHYCIRTDKASESPPIREMEHEGRLLLEKQPNTRIYFADEI